MLLIFHLLGYVLRKTIGTDTSLHFAPNLSIHLNSDFPLSLVTLVTEFLCDIHLIYLSLSFNRFLSWLSQSEVIPETMLIVSIVMFFIFANKFSI